MHVKDKHSNRPSCPFCHIGFVNHVVLMFHIDNVHQELTLKTVKITNDGLPTDNRVERKRGVCAFFFQPQGCKKGSYCDFSHEIGNQEPVKKVPKLCKNGSRCSWKPRCRYLHLEEGDVMPQREQVQGFVMVDTNQPPPGYNIRNSEDFPSLPVSRVEIVENSRVREESGERMRVSVVRLNRSI